MKHDWFWASANHDEGSDTFRGAGRRFVIANGKDELWRRVRREINPDERCAWNAIHPRKSEPALDDVLDMMFTVTPCYGVRLSAFSIEAAQIPVFAKFLRNARASLCNYVSNSAADDGERYDREEHAALGRAVNRTLGIEDDGWWEL